MKLLTNIKKAFSKAARYARITIAVASAILTIMLIRIMGLKGLACFIAGMAVMTVLCVHPKTSFMILTLIDMVNGDRSLMEFMRGGKKDEEKNEWIEVKR